MTELARFPLRFLACLPLLGLLVGCETTTGGVAQPSGPELVARDKALVMPPPGGPAIVGVVQTKRGNGIEQTLSLDTSSSVPGQNYLKLSFQGGDTGDKAPSTAYRPLGDPELRREIASATPGAPLSRSSTFLQNAYGPFGYASGHSRRGDACLYGWQQIRSGSVGNGIGRDFGMIQVKLRICDNRATERELLSVMYGYTIVGNFQGEIWNPYGSPGGVDPRIGQPGQPIYPMPDMTARAMAFGYSPEPVVDHPPVRPRRVAVRPARVSAPVAVSPPPAPVSMPVVNGPRVPLPSGGGATGVQIPQPAPLAATTKSGGAAPVSVPSPDCIGTTAMTAGCSNNGNSKPAQ